MIFKKPYALFIKLFRPMHILIMLGLVFMLYQTGFILSFLNEYISNPTVIRGQDIVSNLHTNWFFIVPVISSVFVIMILSVLINKKKPMIFYIICLSGHFAMMYVYFNGLNVLTGMENTVLDLRTIRAARDLYLYAMGFQFIFIILTLFRGLGFDYKKFDFKVDLENLDISEEDDEEFEIDFDFDLSDQKRKGKRFFRYLKYRYKENKFLARIGLGLLVAFIIFFAYSRYTVYNRLSPEGTNFSMNGSVMGVHRSYLVDTDHKGNDITGGDRVLVVVDLMVRSSGLSPEQLNVGAITLNIAGNRYRHTNIYSGNLNDLGTVYHSQNVSTEFEHYLLVYEIPIAALASRKTLEFQNLHSGNTVRVRLNTVNKLTGRETNHRAILGETMDFSASPLGNTTLRINRADINKRFYVNYTFTPTRTNQQIASVDILGPRVFEHGFSMTLLRVETTFKSEKVDNFPALMSEFGTIEYVIDGETHTQDLYLGTVTSRRRRERNVYYFQIFEEIDTADSVVLVFRIRNDIYRYYIK